MEDLAGRATEAMRSPSWAAAPDETDPRFRKAWRHVSICLQRQLRTWILEDYLADATRCTNRRCTSILVVYAASPAYYPDPSGFEFVRDPTHPDALRNLTAFIQRSIQRILAEMQPRIEALDRPYLARRYRPEWAEDIRREVVRRPTPLLRLIKYEGILIDAIVALGADKNAAAVRNFTKLSRRRLRVDPWTIEQGPLYLRALEETGRQLELV